MERTGRVVKPRVLGREVPGSSLSRVTVRCGLEQITFPQLLSQCSEIDRLRNKLKKGYSGFLVRRQWIYVTLYVMRI